MGFKCHKDTGDYIPFKQSFKESINLSPVRKTYNVNDTIWLSFSTTDKSLFDTVSKQRLPTNDIKFKFGCVLLPKYNTPANLSNSFCKFILSNNVVPAYDTTQFGARVFYDVGCDGQFTYTINLGVVLKYPGIYLLNLFDAGVMLQSCGNQVSPYQSSELRFVYNLLDCNKDVFLSIPAAGRQEFPPGFTEAQIDAKISFAFNVR